MFNNEIDYLKITNAIKNQLVYIYLNPQIRLLHFLTHETGFLRIYC